MTRAASARYRHPRRVEIAAHVLATLFSLYAAAWLLGVTLTQSGIGGGIFFGINIRVALNHIGLFELVLFYMLCALGFAAQALLILRNKAAVLAIGGAVVSHLVLWVRMGDNPAWDSPIGLVVISIEALILVLMLRLQHAGALR
ncbi:hypothetical protein [Maricaulis sp. W15]|uniref:hypothetical protein n=1 Tax=Maricaulis sp. W15 TaxID=1772333 RepID=UPI000AF43F79|nr:hypothetical protein [Maricaulis sp. W15]